ncbi:MAG: protein-export chaperone SecB [Gammaproteobacteria bacterium]|nr:protein-export chaperone SecB [Gammaproteobacteria bacterium]
MAEEKAPQNHFSIQKLYVKDVSFESPDTPKAFNFSKWEPKIELNLNHTHSAIDDKIYEAVLTVTATVKQQEKTAFLVEVQQAGVFAIVGYDENERNYILSSQCMSILFPYAREAISDLTSRGGFPPLVLTPVNFDALYKQHVQQQADKEQGAEQPKKEKVKH